MSTYNITLASRPLSAVSIAVTPTAHGAVVSPGGGVVVFDTSSTAWKTPHAVIILAVQDSINRGAAYIVSVGHSSASADTNYVSPHVSFVPSNASVSAREYGVYM